MKKKYKELKNYLNNLRRRKHTRNVIIFSEALQALSVNEHSRAKREAFSNEEKRIAGVSNLSVPRRMLDMFLPCLIENYLVEV